ncbi:polyphenol oxidase family protein [Acidisphaera sp. L21]|uniref:polyphenol oxidase family protein n=1 Tax=Acidisphaera sp. L21 TaxID=1641851 RepID=UPI00131D508D|nr:polyphenol oxidase family protein [Acidisphaera sp. L21]
MTPHISDPHLAAPHGFFTREGGVSTGPFASLNCSLSSADAPEAVAENRRRAAAAIGVDQLVGLHQVHGPDVVTVDEPWQPGSGPRADAMVTRRPGIGLAIVTADCAPVLFAGPGIVGAAHAGWRGAVSGVLEAVVEAMGGQSIHATVGPCIGPAAYEVAADLRDAVLARDQSDAQFFADGRPGHWLFDLPGYCAQRLRAAGATVTVLGLDTLTDEVRFYSHRRRTLAGGGPIGHQVSIIACPTSPSR